MKMLPVKLDHLDQGFVSIIPSNIIAAIDPAPSRRGASRDTRSFLGGCFSDIGSYIAR
jgi:hypothetical protein